MRTESVPVPTTVRVLQRVPSLPEAIESGISSCELPAMRCDPTAEHDATVLPAALEQLEAQRAAIEWLLDADLLCRCLV